MPAPPRSQPGITLRGDANLMRTMRDLDATLRRKILRKTVRSALSPVNKAAKRNADTSKDTGTLKRSIGIKVKTYPQRGVVWGAVGPRKGMSRYAFTRRGPVKRNPVHYAHLVEYGFIQVRRWGFPIEPVAVPPKPFMRPAWDTARHEAFRTLVFETRKEITRWVLQRARKKLGTGE